MKEEKICPVCGLKMKMLSPQSWTCKCGYTKKGDISEEGKGRRERKREEEMQEVRVRHWEEKKGKIREKTSTRHKKGFGSKKKR